LVRSAHPLLGTFPTPDEFSVVVVVGVFSD
jgi:hypothetical protein